MTSKISPPTPYRSKLYSMAPNMPASINPPSIYSNIGKLQSLAKPSNIIVLDIGEKYTKLGIDGDCLPKAIIPTLVASRDSKQRPPTPDLQPFSISCSSAERNKRIHDYFHSLFYHHLQINSSNISVLMLVALYVPSSVLNEIAQCLFDTYSIHSLLFFPHSLASCMSLGLETALVIDVGYSALRITPIFCANVLPSNARDIPGMGGAVILQWVKYLLCKYGHLQTHPNNKQIPSLKELLTEELLEDIICRVCAVRAMNETRTAPDVQYPLTHPPNTHIVIPGNIRDLTAELILSTDSYASLLDASYQLETLPEYTLPQILLSVLEQCPIDLRVPLSSNIVITGGASDIPGFAKRLQEEVNALKCTEPYSQYIGPSVKFSFHITDTPPGIIGWSGAAILSSCQEAYEQRCLTKERYMEQKGRVNDWLSGNNTLLEKLEYVSDKPQVKAQLSSYAVSTSARARAILNKSVSRQPQQHHASGDRTNSENIANFFKNLATTSNAPMSTADKTS